jgi:hypothetical protein
LKAFAARYRALRDGKADEGEAEADHSSRRQEKAVP